MNGGGGAVDLWSFVVAIGTTAANVAFGSWVAYRFKRRSDQPALLQTALGSLLDGYQRQNEALTKRVEALENRAIERAVRIEALEDENLVKDRRISTLEFELVGVKDEAERCRDENERLKLKLNAYLGIDLSKET